MKCFGARRLARAAVAASAQGRLVGTLSFLSSVFCLLSAVLSGCAATNTAVVVNDATATLSLCPRWWIGETGLNPNDPAAAHALQQSAFHAGSFVRPALNWNTTNGFFTPPIVATNTTNWAYVDRLFSLNAKYNKIIGFYHTDVVTFSNSLIYTIARYTNAIWGVDAFSEPEDGYLGAAYSMTEYSNYVAYVNVARYVIDQAGYHGKIRLLGPCDVNDWIDGVLSTLYHNFGAAFSNLDVIAAHDYFQCPGNGTCTNGMCHPDGTCDGSYAHPTDSPGTGYPNLAGRIANMQYWASVAGITNLVVLEEYCLYCGDVNDARTTARILSSNQNVAVVLTSPTTPMGQVFSCPSCNATTNGTWDAALTAFLNTACTLP